MARPASSSRKDGHHLTLCCLCCCVFHADAHVFNHVERNENRLAQDLGSASQQLGSVARAPGLWGWSSK